MIAPTLLLVLALATGAGASTLDAFAAAWASIASYRATLVMHEVAGNAVEDRTYAYTFEKPSTATIAITSGPGRGGRIAWSGGESVTGTPPGFLSFVKVHLSIHDRRVTTLRGDTIAMASFGWLLDHLRTTPGSIVRTQSTSPQGEVRTELDLTVADPASDGGITREVTTFSTRTNLPTRLERYIGSKPVKDIRYTDVSIVANER